MLKLVFLDRCSDDIYMFNFVPEVKTIGPPRHLRVRVIFRLLLRIVFSVFDPVDTLLILFRFLEDLHDFIDLIDGLLGKDIWVFKDDFEHFRVLVALAPDPLVPLLPVKLPLLPVAVFLRVLARNHLDESAVLAGQLQKLEILIDPLLRLIDLLVQLAQLFNFGIFLFFFIFEFFFLFLFFFLVALDVLVQIQFVGF